MSSALNERLTVPARRFGRPLAVAVLLGLSACAPSHDARMEETYDFVEAWADALTGGAEDRGWSMLSDAARRGFVGEEQYVALAESADWSTFQIVAIDGRCDDLYACTVNLLIPAGIESVPAYLLHSPNDSPTDAHWLIGFNDFDRDGDPDPPDSEFGNAQIQVWWGRVPWPDPGIGGGGG